MRKMARGLCLTVEVVVLVAGLVLPSGARAQAIKKCPSGLTMKVNSAITAQGTLLLAEVKAAENLPDLKGEWNGRGMALWKEGSSTKTLHGLIGVDLEKPAGKYEWKISWADKDGDAVCAAQ